jgi:DNA-binding NarL/FixJ family response regulator
MGISGALIVERQELFGSGLGHLVAKDRSRLKAFVCTSLDGALRELPADFHARLVILDVGAPGVEAAVSTATLRERFPCARTLLTTAGATRREILEYLAWAVHGVVLTSQPISEIAGAIRLVMSGGIFVPPGVCEQTAWGGDETVTLPDGEDESETDVRLSSRQSAVLRLLAAGLSNKAIARELSLSEGTIKVHVAALYKALRVHNRAGATARLAGLGRKPIWHALMMPTLLFQLFPAI